MTLKDFPLQLSLDQYKTLSLQERQDFQSEAYNKLNDKYGPVVEDYAELVEDKDLVIIHFIVDMRCCDCSGDGDSCDNKDSN